MRAVIQRVRAASVRVEGRCVGSVDRGLLVYIGVEKGDDEADVAYVGSKCAGARVFPDAHGRMNLPLSDLSGPTDERRGILAVSQFTLHGDMRKGRRPSLAAAAEPRAAEGLYEALVRWWRNNGLLVETGVFGAHMDVAAINDGPVTLLVDSRRLF